MTLALSGSSSSTAFTDTVDRQGVSPKARAEKEREQQRVFVERQRVSQEQRAELRERLDRLEQASMEALLENEEKLRVARVELERIRERAYEITMPDGTVAKVYRDWNKVRTDSGAEVDAQVLRAEDIPEGSPNWAEQQASTNRVNALVKEQRAILDYRERLKQAGEHSASDDFSHDESGEVGADLEQMPDSVRSKYRDIDGAVRLSDHAQHQDAITDRRTSSHAFVAAVSGEPAVTTADAIQQKIIRRQSADVSAPASR